MTSKQDHNYVVILAGGGGTRLWPRSRSKTPKQFLKIIGNQTMLQLTAERALKVVDWDRIIIVTNQAHVEMVKQQLPAAKSENIILEPEKKDTALAMLVGALYAHSLDPQAVVINSASDHFVTNLPEFVTTMQAASALAASQQALVTVGIAPTAPETGFGYIKIGAEVKQPKKDVAVFEVDSFTEKPNAATAAAFIATGKYFWNANMYVWSSQALIAAFKKYAPAIWQKASVLMDKKGNKFQKALTEVYQDCQAISIDYAISEKADNLLLIPGNFGWSDVGDWKVAYILGKKDSELNVYNDETEGEAQLICEASRENLVMCDNKKLIALLGVEDLVVVETEEILLVAKKNQAQEVKKIVEKLKKQKQEQYL